MAERLLVVLYPGVADWEVTFPLFCLRPGIKDTLASTGRSRVETAMGFEIGVELAGLETVKVQEWINATLFESWLSPYDASLAYALCVVLLWAIPLWAMYKRQIYV